MKSFQRELSGELKKAVRHFGAVIVSGPRRAGKTFLLQQVFPRASYHLLEDPDILQRVRNDPRGWLAEIKRPAIIDEVQNAPDLLPYIRTIIDQKPSAKGQWLLTGSQEFSLMEGVVESMAGRAAIFNLAPLSFREMGRWQLIQGGFPEVVLRPTVRRLWFSSYIQTYLERDVRAIKAVKDLSTFRRFLSLVAARHGQVLNKSDLAAPLGISVPTVAEWLGILETTGQILVVPPYFENFGKRLIKSPRVYWIDSGLVCFLLGLETQAQLERSPFLGSVFEGFVAGEIFKSQINRGMRKEVYFFRDEQGLEVDFIVPQPGGGLCLIEAKWTATITPDMAKPLTKLMAAMSRTHQKIEARIVHRKVRSAAPMQSVAPQIKAIDVESFLRNLK